ncbi:hypothetical protein DRZ78_02600 [Candidatus Aerophobetes bacterium]|uniref:Putative zinc-finger domain-containing protein n=1 Tax=Aerophobetes bacterium TaxID=2030807 RepID=A0A662D1A2_UNCAE|nr:MAG: hypothetical protein DRZ78_02600 [Candidatus Aerophobetes bacterium]
MKCKKIRKKLVAYLDGELEKKQRLLIEEHLLRCAECKKEVDLLSKTLYLLKDQQRLKPSEDFEANLWEKIYSKERQVLPHFLRRRAYLILPAAVAAALIIGVVIGNLLGKVISFQNVNLEEEYLSSIGLDNFQDLPPGSLPDVYFSLANQQR